MSCTRIPTGQREVECVQRQRNPIILRLTQDVAEELLRNEGTGRREVEAWICGRLNNATDCRTAITIGRALRRFIVFEDELEVEVIGKVLLESLERKELWKHILRNFNSNAVTKCQRWEWKLVSLHHYCRKSLMLIKSWTKDSFFNSNRGLYQNKTVQINCFFFAILMPFRPNYQHDHDL